MQGINRFTRLEAELQAGCASSCRRLEIGVVSTGEREAAKLQVHAIAEFDAYEILFACVFGNRESNRSVESDAGSHIRNPKMGALEGRRKHGNEYTG